MIFCGVLPREKVFPFLKKGIIMMILVQIFCLSFHFSHYES